MILHILVTMWLSLSLVNRLAPAALRRIKRPPVAGWGFPRYRMGKRNEVKV